MALELDDSDLRLRNNDVGKLRRNSLFRLVWTV